MSNEKDFVIENGMLRKYVGDGGDVVIPKGVTSIGDYAFKNCSSVTSVTVPNGVIEVGVSAFLRCTGLTSVVLPEGVISVEYSAFEGCTSLISINIPKSLVKICFGAFGGCTSLASVDIPGGVTEIAPVTFEGCTSLASVIISEGVTKIGMGAFEGCTSLASIDIPNSMQKIEFGAFKGCTNLESVTIQSEATKIGMGAFDCCPNLKNLIGADREIQSVIDGILYIGTKKNPYIIVKAAADGYSASLEIHEGAKEILPNAFDGCVGLTNIAIPDGVTSIGNAAFRGCSSLTTIRIPDSVTEIGDSVFYGCKKLVGITVPDGVTSIGRSVFEDCSALTTIRIPDSVTEIGDSAFYGCKKLVGITIPDGVTRIGNYTFYRCASLKEFNLPKNFVIEDLIFGDKVPRKLLALADSLIPHFSEQYLFYYFVDQDLELINVKARCKIFMSHQDRNAVKTYAYYTKDANALGEELYSVLSEQLSANECTAVTNFLLLFFKKAEKSLLQKLYQKLKSQKGVSKYLKKIKAIPVLMKMLDEGGISNTAAINPLWDGLHFSADGTKLLECPAEEGQKIYHVPDGTVEICNGAFDMTPLKEIYLPESVTTIRNYAFLAEGRGTLFVKLPASLEKLPKEAIFIGENDYTYEDEWGRHYYISTPNIDIAEQICLNYYKMGEICPVYTGGGIEDFDTKNKPLAVKGFLYACEHNLADMSKWRDGYLQHIKKNEKTYIKLAENNEFLLNLMVAEKLLSASGTKALLKKLDSKKHAASAAVLLAYQKENFADKQKDEFDLSDDNPEIKRMQKTAERREQIKGQTGIAGLAFVATGELDNFGFIDEYTGAHDLSDLKEFIEARGGFLRSAVSSKTDYLICNDPGSTTVKSRKAKELGTPVITEAQFLKMAEEQ